MTIDVQFSCGGCEAKATGQLKSNFEGFNGKSYGWGVRRETTAQEAAPEGWIAFDPYTFCTYCPTCWAGIEGSLDQ